MTFYMSFGRLKCIKSLNAACRRFHLNCLSLESIPVANLKVQCYCPLQMNGLPFGQFFGDIEIATGNISKREGFVFYFMSIW